jgi:hypothetical protein
VAFRPTNGNRHDIEEAENLLRRCMGTAIGDKDYCSNKIKERFAQIGIRSIARENMQNEDTEEEKNILQQRNTVERVF